jgi:hypothetical protein
MNIWIVVAIIIVVIGFIVGNIMLLQQTAKEKLPKPNKDNNANFDDDDDWGKK